jgi:hypothetical protein
MGLSHGAYEIKFDGHHFSQKHGEASSRHFKYAYNVGAVWRDT